MEIMNLLSGALDQARNITFLGQTYDVYLNWIGKIIRWLVSGIGIVGVGIIVFSIVLRMIVLPFDIYQRIAMSKQNIKMRENQDKLEKLKKQYANDKNMYNQKMMEMYKANGISMFSSCLPAILSMVIFIVAINAFNAFSQYSNLQNYNAMVEAYNAAITPYAAVVDNAAVSIETQSTENGEKSYLLFVEEGKCVYFAVPYDNAVDITDADAVKSYIADKDRSYFIDPDLYYALDGMAEKVDAYIAANSTEDNTVSKAEACARVMEKSAQQNVKKVYDEKISDNMSFLWIKNIWETDASYKHPVLSYSDFKSDLSNSKYIKANGDKAKFSKLVSVSPYNEMSYNAVTGELKAEKKSANGYFVLIALSIGTILLQQFVSMRSQKEQQKYSTVDGQGGLNQKTMMIMMTVMFAIFAFMYSAAFSIYMIMSNILSMFTTLIINKLVQKSMDKKEAQALQEKYNNRFPNRSMKGMKAVKDGKNEKKNK